MAFPYYSNFMPVIPHLRHCEEIQDWQGDKTLQSLNHMKDKDERFVNALKHRAVWPRVGHFTSLSYDSYVNE